MRTYHTNCQSIVTNIAKEIDPWLILLDANKKKVDSKFDLNLDQHQRPMFIAYLKTMYHSKAFIYDGSLQNAKIQTDLLNAWQGLFKPEHSWHLISGELSQQEISGDAITDLSKTVHSILNKSLTKHLLIPSQFLDLLIPDQTKYQKKSISINIGERRSINDLSKKLVSNGYIRHSSSLDKGSFIVRGEQLDIQHPVLNGTFTITFYGSIVETITHETGRRERISNLNIPPSSLTSPTSPLSSFIKDQVILRSFHHPSLGQREYIYDSPRPNGIFPYESANKLAKHFTGALYKNLDHVKQYLEDHDVDSTELCSSPLANHNIHLSSANFQLISERAIFPNQDTSLSAITHKEGMILVGELEIGKPAVHSDHGIGIFEGLQNRIINDNSRDYLILRYAAGDTLSVPVEYAHKVTAYVGDVSPRLNRLGGTTWQKTKRKANQDAEQFAKELLTTAGKRDKNSRHPYIIDSTIEDDLNKTFNFELTPDQKQAWHDIKEDLADKAPMDRLIVGDVGFGKTELAIRTARHVASGQKQVAILAPTTLLVQQHFDTFSERLKHIEKVSLLSRFASSSEMAKTRENIESGNSRIVIGTHALLSEKTKWHNLGLIIIDEEQRFGVKHKEHFKKIRSEIDILSLSATPIPRTLAMSLSGLKKLSIISTPPKGRQSTKSNVALDNDQTLKEAIEFEKQRGGQIYLVAPRVRQLGTLAHRVHKLVPSASFAIAHGQMPSKKLASTMKKFDNLEIDVLISSTIIESGLDLPNANTIIVTNATHFGLAELYQLRGRVGRRKIQGHAHFIYKQGRLTNDQRQRLSALTEASRLGSGWSLAQRDLEMRGAGNLLGAEQSGTVNAVGVQLYLDLIKDAVTKEKRQDVTRHEVNINLPVPAVIPSHYIASTIERTKIYQKLARASNEKDISALISQINGKYGTPPRELENLALMLNLQLSAAKHLITDIDSKIITPSNKANFYRISVNAKNINEVIPWLPRSSKWKLQEGKAHYDIKQIQPLTIQQLILCLNRKDHITQSKSKISKNMVQ